VTPDPARRDWWPPTLDQRWKAAITLALGLALVLTPLWAGPLITALSPQDTYRYEAVAVRPTNGSIAVDGGDLGVQTHGIRGIDCFVDDFEPQCVYAYAARNVTTRLPDERSTLSGFLHLERFYEPVVTPRDDGNQFSLAPVPAGQVLANVSEAPADLSDGGRRVLKAGSLETTDRLPAEGTIADTDSGYRLVALTATDRASGAVPLPSLVLIELHGVVLGLVVLRAGQTTFDQWQETVAD
jgi:hypothetical protein